MRTTGHRARVADRNLIYTPRTRPGTTFVVTCNPTQGQSVTVTLTFASGPGQPGGGGSWITFRDPFTKIPKGEK